jgi:hypothetical protein
MRQPDLPNGVKNVRLERLVASFPNEHHYIGSGFQPIDYSRLGHSVLMQTLFCLVLPE